MSTNLGQDGAAQSQLDAAGYRAIPVIVAPDAHPPGSPSHGALPPGTVDALPMAVRLVEAARAGRIDVAASDGLAHLSATALRDALADDAARIAFWSNVYNGAVRARLLADPTRFRRRTWFFVRPVVTIAGRRLSPNAIEHGMLRRSALLVGLGYLRNPWPSRFERAFRVRVPDPRIHFALDCGARSCPPLRTWHPETLERDLEAAAAAYVRAESRRSLDGRTVIVPRLLAWYRGDFGGKQGILRLLRRHAVIDAREAPHIRFGEYDWTLDVEPSESPGSDR